MTGKAAFSAAKPTTTNVELAGPAALVLLLLAGPALYGVGLWAASVADGQPLSRAVCFDATVADHLAPVRLMIATAMAAGAFLLFFATPWMLGAVAVRRTESKRATAGAWSLAANSAALILVCLVLRNTVGVNRGSFLVAWLAWSGVLLLAAWRPASSPGEIGSLRRRWGVGMLIGVAAVTAGIVLFRREHFIQCFNGDGTEQFELARSLRDSFLPYFEIEAGSVGFTARFGTYIANPTVICSYWTLPWQLLLGEGELATRLPCWVWWLGIFAVSLGIVQGKEGRTAVGGYGIRTYPPPRWLPAIPLALALLLTCVWYTFYVGYYPYMTDPASPGVLDALFTLLILLALNCLRQGDSAGWVVSMILASLIFYAGPVIFMITAAAACFWQPVPRKQVVRATLVGMLAISGIIVGYLVVGWWEGLLSGWWATLHRECFDKFFAPGPRWHANLLFVGYFLLGCGAVPAVALVRAFGGKSAEHERAWDRTVATVTLAYLLFLLVSGHKNLHYLGPLLPIPLILWLKRPERRARQTRAKRATGGWAPALLAAGALAASLLLSWPASRPLFRLNRQLGRLTTFQTDRYEEACSWARIAHELRRQRLLGWRVGEHTWVKYSEVDAQPLDPRPLVITDGAAPSPGHELVFESRRGARAYSVRLYSADPQVTDWLARQQPPAGAERYPRVFRTSLLPSAD